MASDKPPRPKEPRQLEEFGSELVDRIRRGGNTLNLPGGQLLLPRVYGFCRGVTRALAMLRKRIQQTDSHKGRLFLMGQIIHNPWVNEYFQQSGVQMLSETQRQAVEQYVTPDDCAVIPAFGVLLEIERKLKAVGCEIVDTTCPDVRRLWAWAEQATEQGYAVLIFGRCDHDETVVTKSRLEAAGGKYLVVGRLEQAKLFSEMLAGDRPEENLPRAFGADTTNAESIQQFARVAQVSQTTMLYDETMKVRRLLQEAFIRKFGPEEATEHLLFEPTVCRATQDRQTAAVELCRSGCDLVIVVGGYGSSNTRHLYELASNYTEAVFIEDASAIMSRNEIHSFDPDRGSASALKGWLPARRPLKIGVLAGASTPEFVVGEVLERLAEFLSES